MNNKNIVNDLVGENKELVQYLTKKLYRKEIKTLKSINKYIEIKDKKNYFFSRQVYLNILKRNEITGAGYFERKSRNPESSAINAAIYALSELCITVPYR